MGLSASICPTPFQPGRFEALAARLIDGTAIEWERGNRVGLLDDDACAAKEELTEMLEDLDDHTVEVWSVSNWLFGCDSLLGAWSGAPLDDAVQSQSVNLSGLQTPMQRTQAP